MGRAETIEYEKKTKKIPELQIYITIVIWFLNPEPSEVSE